MLHPCLVPTETEPLITWTVWASYSAWTRENSFEYVGTNDVVFSRTVPCFFFRLCILGNVYFNEQRKF